MSSDRTIVLSGATRGLGRALVSGFIERGATVIGCGRDEARLAALRGQFGAPHEFEVVDVTSDTVDGWAAGVVARHGAPDLLINNAGIINKPAALWTVPRREFDRVLATNVGGTFRILAAYLPAMVERSRGIVVNLSSGWGRSAAAGMAPYCASKFAVEGLTRALARELREGMAAVALNPGIVDTDMLRTVWADDAAAYPEPAAWAERAVPFILALGPKDNGASLTVP